MSSSTPPKQPGEFPFPGTLPLKITSETMVNPEGREEEGSDYAQTLISTPDGSIHRVLFPDLSQWDPSQSLPSPAGIRLGHFEITDRIGTGGMGSVFLATDLHLQRYVALKILSPSQAMGGTSVQRFMNEARAAARLDYDGISRVFYYGEDKGFHFIAFEYVTGINIREMIHARGPLPPREALNYALQLAHALKHTSAAGVVHRDIKPSNIIVGPSGRAKLVDLGLARKESTETMDELTVAGTTLGTFDYISPEQAQDPRNVDIRSDIYSLGCTLYHMLTGEPPYPDGTLAQKLIEHQREFVPDPSVKNRKVSARFAAITQKMMASDPAKRHQTPEALIRDLLEVAGYEGLQGVTPEGLVWTGNQRRFGRDWMIRHASWISAVLVLLTIVFSLNFIDDEPETQNLGNETAGLGNNPDAIPEESPNSSNLNQVDREGEANLAPGSFQLLSKPPHETSQSIQGALPASSDPSLSDGILDPSRPFVGETYDPLNLFPPLTSTEEQQGFVIPMIPETSLPVLPDSKPEEKAPVKADPPVIVGVKDFPVLMRSSSGKESPYQTLEAACAEARDGSEIELHYNGRRERSEKPIVINGDLTIRAAEGYHPLISFESSEYPDPNDARMITLQAGSLELKGVEIELVIRHPLRDVSKDEWVLFSLPEAEKLRLDNVVLTIRNSALQQPAAFLLVGKGTEKMKQMPSVGNTAGVIPFEVEISNTLIRGETDGILLEHIRPGQIRMSQTMLLLENSLLVNRGSSDMPDEYSDIQLSLSHVTCVTGNSPLRIESGKIPREILPLQVSSENSLYYLPSIGLAPFVSMSGETNATDFSKSLAWGGIHNWYRGFQKFRTINDSLGFSSLQDLDFEEWRAYWTLEERGYEENAVSKEIFWQSTWQDKPYSEFAPDQFKLDLALIADDRVYSEDGTPVGALTESLPIPLEYRSLKRESEVQPPLEPLIEPTLED